MVASLNGLMVITELRATPLIPPTVDQRDGICSNNTFLNIQTWTQNFKKNYRFATLPDFFFKN